MIRSPDATRRRPLRASKTASCGSTCASAACRSARARSISGRSCASGSSIACRASSARARRSRPRTHVGPSFHFARAASGRPPDTEELVVPSPFDFASRRRALRRRDLPEPSEPGFRGRARSGCIASSRPSPAAARSSSARRTARCAAIHAARSASSASRARSSSRARRRSTSLSIASAQQGNAVLVATMSFWEGVDVPGHALRLVIIDKIPFAVPTDPSSRRARTKIESEGGKPVHPVLGACCGDHAEAGFRAAHPHQERRRHRRASRSPDGTKGYGKPCSRACRPRSRALLEELREFARSSRSASFWRPRGIREPRGAAHERDHRRPRPRNPGLAGQSHRRGRGPDRERAGPRGRAERRLDRRARGDRASRRRQEALTSARACRRRSTTSTRRSARRSSACRRARSGRGRQASSSTPTARRTSRSSAPTRSSASRWPSRAPPPTRSASRSGATSAASTRACSRRRS